MTELKRQIAESIRAVRRVLRGRSLWSCLLAFSLALTILGVSEKCKLVYISDSGMLTTCYTMRDTASDILKQNNVSVGADDIVRFDGFYDKIGVIEVDRAFPVTLTADGKTIEAMAVAKTVGDFIKENNISLGEFDMIEPPVSEVMLDDTDIVVSRIDVETTVVTEEVPYDTQYKYNSLLRNGRSRTLIAGTTGEKVLTYVDRIVDGELQERELVNTVVTKQSSDELVLIGSDDPVSSLDFGVELDENGIPKSYKKVLKDQICTGYSSKLIGVKGASGMYLHAGSVAVRAKDIPYGTKMYITSDTGFVYGFAIAADTGVALMNNVIDVDLFYETYRESALNGRKICDVYILN